MSPKASTADAAQLPSGRLISAGGGALVGRSRRTLLTSLLSLSGHSSLAPLGHCEARRYRWATKACRHHHDPLCWCTLSTDCRLSQVQGFRCIPLQAVVMTFMVKPSSWSLPIQDGPTHAAGRPTHSGSLSESVPTAATSGTSPSMSWMDDV